MLDRRHARSNFLGYHGFPAVACISPNEVIVHGIPGDRRLEDGDIVSIDCGAIIEGWHADAAITVAVGEIDDESQRLHRGHGRRRSRPRSGEVRSGNRLTDIGAACEAVVTEAGFSVVREYVGHGIGTAMHEEPDVPNYGPPGRGLQLKDGPRARHRADGQRGRRRRPRLLDDGWTVVTADGARSAHFEHTVAITDDGPEILHRLPAIGLPAELSRFHPEQASGMLFGRPPARFARSGAHAAQASFRRW